MQQSECQSENGQATETSSQSSNSSPTDRPRDITFTYIYIFLYHVKLIRSKNVSSLNSVERPICLKIYLMEKEKNSSIEKSGSKQQ